MGSRAGEEGEEGEVTVAVSEIRNGDGDALWVERGWWLEEGCGV